MERRLWYIKHAEFFSWLADEEQQQLASRTEMVSCRRNCQLFFADDPSDNIYLVKKGQVKLTRTSADGREIILDILGPGEIFGELALAGEKVRSHSAEAVRDALVCIIPRKVFENLLQSHPEMTLRVLKLVGLRRRELEMKLEDLVFQPLAGRLGLALLGQSRRHGTRETDGSIRIPITQSDLAHLVGASREAVAEQLAGFKRQGLIDTSYRAIRLIDSEGLRKFCASQSADRA
jgi:CRP/FNR family transcriptional regulator